MTAVHQCKFELTEVHEGNNTANLNANCKSNVETGFLQIIRNLIKRHRRPFGPPMNFCSRAEGRFLAAHVWLLAVQGAYSAHGPSARDTAAVFMPYLSARHFSYVEDTESDEHGAINRPEPRSKGPCPKPKSHARTLAVYRTTLTERHLALSQCLVYEPYTLRD